MSQPLCAGLDGPRIAEPQVVFDAERETPDLIDRLAQEVPHIRQVMTDLRKELPLVPHSGVGPLGRFYRLPNHYRSVSFLLSPADTEDPESSAGVIVFKGTEPLLPDFAEYLDWMLGAPFRASPLPLGLHFPLDMKLPPAAMWIEECKAEQAVASRLQRRYLARHGRLARLPLPLFVHKMTPEQMGRYEGVIRSRLSDDALWKIRNKLVDGLGVEIYYYPELPVRAADLMVGNVRETFKLALSPQQMVATFESWTKLMAEMLCLDYMPYAPWHHGMGGCVDPGNACIDGGFNDLLTLVPFDAIPDEVLFRRSLQSSINILADSMSTMSAAAVGIPAIMEPDAASVPATYIADRLREFIRNGEGSRHAIDERLKQYFEATVVADIGDMLRKTHKGRGRSAQFMGKAQRLPQEPALPKFVAAAIA